MVGQLGSVEIAAVGLGNQIFFVMTVVIFGIVSGGSIFIAQFWGKKDIDGVHRTFGITLSLSFVISAVFFIAAFFFPRTCLSLYSSDAVVIQKGSEYLRVVSISYIFTGIGFAIGHAERSTEHVKLPMIATIISVVINAILNYLFIFGISLFGTQIIEPMGIIGAAIATNISRVIELLILIIFAYARKYEIAVNPRRLFKTQPGFLARYIKVCLPVLLNESLWGIGMSMQNSILAHAGTAEIAAFNINSTISNLIWPFFLGSGNATAIIIGKKIGEGAYEETKKLAKKISLFLVASSIPFALILISLTKTLPFFFNVEPEVIHMATVFIIIKACIYPFDAFNMCSVVGICRAGGDTIFAMIMDVGLLWILSLPLGAAAVYIWHFPYWLIYMCILTESIGKAIIAIYRVASGKWLKDVTI